MVRYTSEFKADIVAVARKAEVMRRAVAYFSEGVNPK